jgi:hypothetical protein
MDSAAGFRAWWSLRNKAGLVRAQASSSPVATVDLDEHSGQTADQARQHLQVAAGESTVWPAAPRFACGATTRQFEAIVDILDRLPECRR